MDQQKMGMLIKKLRKEKGLTQEQFAEHLNVTSRTVSRWETGSNIPDLAMLVVLADYFKVDIRELIDGERREEQIDIRQQQQETLLIVADYSECKEKILVKQIHGVIVSGIFAFGASFVSMFSFINSAIIGAELLLPCELLAFLLYNGGMFFIRANRTPSGYRSSLIGAFIAVTLSNLALLLIFFRSGSYCNYGMIGAYYALLALAIAFTICGVVTTVINKSREAKSAK